jgi:hypothetical protein
MMRTLKSGAGISFKYPARKFIFLKNRFIYFHFFMSLLFCEPFYLLEVTIGISAAIQIGDTKLQYGGQAYNPQKHKSMYPVPGIGSRGSRKGQKL